MYTYNRIAKDFYLNFGGVQTTVPLELNYKEIEFRGLAGDEMIVYGYMPAMISAGCGLKTCNSCKSDNSTYEVVDKHRNRFVTKCVCIIVSHYPFLSFQRKLFPWHLIQ